MRVYLVKRIAAFALIGAGMFFLGSSLAAAQPTKWPRKATKQNITKIIGNDQWNKAIRVAICETGLTVNWHLDGTYRGALGMYVTTFQYGQRATGGYAGTTLPEQVAIAIASFPITRGWSGWGCGNA
jgi:hypothetical protein